MSIQCIERFSFRMNFQLCEMESISTNDETFKEKLTYSRLYIGISYHHTDLLQLLIEELIRVCTSIKWHARRAAIEFAQNLIFCNLFTAHPYAQQLHTLVFNCLIDEQYEVRLAASTTLAGFYQCGYLPVTADDLVRDFLSNEEYQTVVLDVFSSIK